MAAHLPWNAQVVASRGGKRDPQAEEQRFLVPSSDYEVGRFGFVIDQTCHQPTMAHQVLSDGGAKPPESFDRH